MSTAGHYVAAGYSGVVVLHSEWKEESSGYQNETTTQTVVCREQGGAWVRLDVVWYSRTMGGTDQRVVSRKEITQAEYEATLTQHNGKVLDTPQFYDRARRATAAQQAFDAIRPPCPTCKRPMKASITRDGNRRFWGCTRFPNCKGSQSMTPAEQARVRSLEDDGAR